MIIAVYLSAVFFQIVAVLGLPYGESEYRSILFYNMCYFFNSNNRTFRNLFFLGVHILFVSFFLLFLFILSNTWCKIIKKLCKCLNKRL